MAMHPPQPLLIGSDALFSYYTSIFLLITSVTQPSAFRHISTLEYPHDLGVYVHIMDALLLGLDNISVL